MNITLEYKYAWIMLECAKSSSKNPVELATSIMKRNFINIHGPEHHFLNGVAFIVAYKNAGGEIDLEDAFVKLSKRSILMPGGMCGYWGICGGTASIGAALAVINQTEPLSDNDHYRNNMEFTSMTIGIMSKIGGPRCCKRNAYLSLSSAVKFVKEKYGIEMESNEIRCDFSSLNNQCIKERCPFYKPQN